MESNQTLLFWDVKSAATGATLLEVAHATPSAAKFWLFLGCCIRTASREEQGRVLPG